MVTLIIIIIRDREDIVVTLIIGQVCQTLVAYNNNILYIQFSKLIIPTPHLSDNNCYVILFFFIYLLL